MTVKIESAKEGIVRLCDGSVITIEFTTENIFRIPIVCEWPPTDLDALEEKSTQLVKIDANPYSG